LAQGGILNFLRGKRPPWASALQFRERKRDLHDAFDLAYRTSRWTEQGNRSGPGSDPEACRPMCLGLSEFIRSQKITSIVDVSCGGMAWWPQVLDECEEEILFSGYDVSKVVIDNNRNRFRDRPNWRFGVADARVFNYPDADLFVCRQTINHLWSDDAVAVVRNISRRARRFVALTNNTGVEENPTDATRIPLMPPRSEATRYTRLNLNAKPFQLPPAVYSLQDVEGESLEIFLSEHPRQESCCIISAFIGETLDFVRQSPAPKDRSFFWANKEEFRDVIERAGWTFIHDNDFADDPCDPVKTSIRSKYFKFLQFMHDESRMPLRNFRFALWADTKRIPESPKAFKAFMSASPKSERWLPGVTIRTTPPLKETLDAEIEAAMPQERYARTMNAVRDVIRKEINEKGARNEVRICNTGLILFDLANPEVHELNRLIYESTVLTQNPECQIFFALFRQRFSENLINVVPYEMYPSVTDS
jgi:Methyltransferase domain